MASMPLIFSAALNFPSFRFIQASSSSASLDTGFPKAKSIKIAYASPWFEETKGRIAKLFDKNEISISTYDTAWVAMVPSPFSKAEPCFPDSLLWLLENQCPDGSWARPHHHSLLRKDVLSSTLASVLALKKWGLGQQHIDKGLHYLELNFGSAMDESQITPMGFEIIFPAMLDEARALSLNPSLDQTTLNNVMNLRDLELKRCYQSSSKDKEAYMAYIGEGMGELHDWESSVINYQRKNGSLFNSPSTTAAAFTALPNNSDCLNYLNQVVNKFGGAVPAVYPRHIYCQLCTVDYLERLGISRYFTTQIRSTLDQTYRCWVQGDEEIFMDASTCASAFRILRMNGYNVTLDQVSQEGFQIPSSVGEHMTADVTTILELYRATEVELYPNETQLGKQHSRLRSILEHHRSSRGSIRSSQLNAEVQQALDYPFYAIMERMATRKYIEHRNFDNTRMLKTSYCLPNLGNKDFLHFAVEDFNRCQAIHREEFGEFKRWVVENRLDELEFLWHKGMYCYLSAAATIFAPELSDARMWWAKTSLLVTLMDDLFDVRGSAEEMKKLIELVELWDVDVSTECCSRNVQIIFSALKSTTCEAAEKGYKLQGRCITSHIVAIWLDLLYSFVKEVEWRDKKSVPAWEEYMSNGYVSIGLGPIVLPSLYLVGPNISEEMVNHSGYHGLFKSMGTCSRLLNDIRGYEREVQEGNVSAIPLYIAENGEMSMETAISKIEGLIDMERKELLRLVLEEEKDGSSNTSVLPRSCKELFWHMSSMLHVFYNKDDGYTSKELIQVLNGSVHQPIILLHQP